MIHLTVNRAGWSRKVTTATQAVLRIADSAGVTLSPIE
jgi:hypothetical protein